MTYEENIKERNYKENIPQNKGDKLELSLVSSLFFFKPSFFSHSKLDLSIQGVPSGC